MTGFEDRVRSGLEVAAGEYEPSPRLRREVDRRVKRHRRGRIATGVVGTVGALLFVAGLGVLLATDDEGNQNESTAATTLPGGWSEIEVLGLRMEVPATWWQQSFDADCNGPYRGVLASNVADDLGFVPEPLCAAPWRLTEPGQVVVELSVLRSEPSSTSTARAETAFPITGDAVAPGSAKSGEPRGLPIVVDGVELARLSLWVAPGATDADLATAYRIIESIRPA